MARHIGDSDMDDSGCPHGRGPNRGPRPDMDESECPHQPGMAEEPMEEEK